MASTGNFQLFPPTLPKINTTIESNPFRKPKPNAEVRGASFPLQKLAKSPDAETVIIQIIEEPRRIQPLPRAHVASPQESSPRVARGQQTGNETPVGVSSSVRVPSPLPPPPLPPAPASAGSASLTLVRSHASATPLSAASSSISPVVPMRSMFPTYNHSIPLNQQQYYPQRATGLQGQVASREEYSPRIASPSQLDEVLGGVRTAPSSVVDFPMDDATVRGPQCSSPRELDKLWEATNGQEPNAILAGFDLQMSRVESATFNFGSNPSQPFYTLETFSTNELSISRTNPRKPTAKIPILLLSVERESRRLPPNDGLVTYIFPKLAAMLAIDQSNELAAEHGLAPTHRDEMQTEAVARAAAQESCKLSWNESKRRYELAHPAIGRDPTKSPTFELSPTSPLEADLPVLHLTISSHALSSPASLSTTPPVILVTNPNASSPCLSTPSNTRVSTLPVPESDEPLASLDLASMSLHISARLILQLMPSLYAIDCIVSAIMAVAVADSATNPILAGMDLWTPLPRMTSPSRAGSVFGGASIAGKSYAGSTLYATLAEREEAEDEARLMRQVHERDTIAKKKGGKETGKKSFWRRRANKPEEKEGKKKTKQILVGEFDLEKLGHYQSGEREGEKLPGVTRSVIKGMVLLLQFVVFFLTTLVRVLTWLLVGVSRAVTSEKF